MQREDRTRRTFEEWVIQLPREITSERPPPDVPKDDPSAFSASAAFLLSEGMLLPNAYGNPDYKDFGGDLDHLVESMYVTAFSGPAELDPDMRVMAKTWEFSDGFYVTVAGVGPDHRSSRGSGLRLLFGDWNVPLSVYACKDLADLSRVYDKVCASSQP